MRSDAGMANRQWDVDLSFGQVSAPQLTFWLGLVCSKLHIPYSIGFSVELRSQAGLGCLIFEGVFDHIHIHTHLCTPSKIPLNA